MTDITPITSKPRITWFLIITSLSPSLTLLLSFQLLSLSLSPHSGKAIYSS